MILVISVVVSWIVGAFSFVILGWSSGHYLHPVKSPSRVLSFCDYCKQMIILLLQNSWGLEQMILALWWRLPTTIYVDDMVWWLSHCKYKSVWVGFLYVVVLRLSSCLGVTKMSKKSMEPSVFESSLVNCMCWSRELMQSKKVLLWADFMTTTVSSINLFYIEGGVVMCSWLQPQNLPYKDLLLWDQLESP